MRRIVLILLLCVVVAGVYFALRNDDGDTSTASLQEIGGVVESVRAASFPQLQDVKITLHGMRSDYIYLESRFAFPSFFARRLSYMISFNPEATARQAPADGLRAIVAHELSHIDYFEKQSRMGLLGLVQLLSARYNARFERSADLETIRLGYGPGLESYRVWLYRNVPASRMEEKKRDYFSPPEIEAILESVRQNPQVMRTFLSCIPGDLQEIQQESQNPVACRGGF